MKYTNGAQVVDAKGEKIGEIDRVVIDPKVGEVTHVVVRKGFLFQSDKVLPVDWVHSSDENTVQLNENIYDPDKLPDFMEVDYIPLDPDEVSRWGYQSDMIATPMYWYPPIGYSPLMMGRYGRFSSPMGSDPATGVDYNYQVEVERNTRRAR